MFLIFIPFISQKFLPSSRKYYKNHWSKMRIKSLSVGKIKARKKITVMKQGKDTYTIKLRSGRGG